VLWSVLMKVLSRLQTFIGALVSRIIRDNTSESILCVCYTNHALDQFLEHMLEAGEKRLVRLGGRSKSTKIAAYQLKALSQSKVNKNSFCQRRIRQVDAQLYKLRESIEKQLKIFQNTIEWKSPFGGVRALLESDKPETLGFLRAPQQVDKFNLVGPNGKAVHDDYLWGCWRRGESLPPWIRHYLDCDTTSVRFETLWASSQGSCDGGVEKSIVPACSHIFGRSCHGTELA